MYKLCNKKSLKIPREVIRIRKSKKNRPHNSRTKKDKQRSTKHKHKTKDRVNVCVLIEFLLFQQSRRACLKNTSIHGGHVFGICVPANCQRDQNAICAAKNNTRKVINN